MKATVLFRILHFAALGVGTFGFGIAVWTWFSSRLSGGGATMADRASLGGLVLGFGLGVALLWSALRPAALTMRTTVVLYAAWIGVFAWYWFNRFAVTEIHSLDPEKIAREQAQQTAVSIGFFLLWVGLYLIGPVLRTRQLRH